MSWLWALSLSLILSSSALAASPPCPAPVPEPGIAIPLSSKAASKAYLQVAEEEEATGSASSALTAFGAAVLADPFNVQARERWNALCGAEDEWTPRLAEAVTLFEKGRHREAAELFASVRAVRKPMPEHAVLEAICWYELGDDAQARPLFASVQEDETSRETATLFLGLIALRNAEGPTAATYFQTLTADEQSVLHKDALGLLRLARQSGRWVFTLLASGGYDSNSDLLPDAAASLPVTLAGPAVDGVVSTLIRPWANRGPFARASLTLRKDLIPNTEHQGSLSAGVGWQLGTNLRHLLIEYSFDFIEVGGVAFVRAHRGQTAARWSQGAWGVGLLAQARWVEYPLTTFQPYTGARFEPQLEARYRFGPHTLRGAARYFRASTATAPTSFHAGGFELSALFDWAPLRLLVEPFWETRRYDAFDATLGVLRADQNLGATVGVDVDLGLHWTWQVTLTARHTLSNAPVSPNRVTAWTGISYTLGVL